MKKKAAKQPVKRIKAGTSKAAKDERRIKFVAAYILNGSNAKQAAISAGYAPSGAEATGSRLTRDSKVVAALAELAKKAAGIAGLSIERHMIEVARLAYSDPRKLYRNGMLLDVEDLDDDAAATVANVEVDEITTDGVVIGRTKKLKLWDKNTALTTGAKILGMFEDDNRQKAPTVVVVSGLDAQI